jgi:glycosyltransferase involved in cell wall biosynthesis
LLDTASGAARSVRTQLETLADRGWICKALTGSVLDEHKAGAPLERLSSWDMEYCGAANDLPLWGVLHGGVEHLLMLFDDARRSHVNAHEEYAFFLLFCHELENWRPDVVYVYGGWLLERALLCEARARSVPTAFYLANATYKDARAFAAVDAIFTPTQVLADYYRNRLEDEAQPIGSFVRAEAVRADRTNADCITFINPEPCKGIVIVLEIARQCRELLPQARLLVVESRGTRQSVTEAFGIDWREYPNIEFIPHQQDVRAVYARSKILLFPSLCFEAGGRVLREAVANGIPVLASSEGGNEEMLCGGGTILPVPLRCCEDYLARPTADEIRPWLECLVPLLSDSQAYVDACARAKAASQKHDLNALSQRLDSMLRDLVARRHS